MLAKLLKKTLQEIAREADVFIGVAPANSVDHGTMHEILRHMAQRPIIFALSNPRPEITPEEVSLVRDDAIIATGRSDYKNQVNNLLCFPYMFRGALDARASQITDGMKLAAAKAIALLARETVLQEMCLMFPQKNFTYGPDYIIPHAFDPRLREKVAKAVSEAAVLDGVAYSHAP